MRPEQGNVIVYQEARDSLHLEVSLAFASAKYHLALMLKWSGLLYSGGYCVSTSQSSRLASAKQHLDPKVARTAVLRLWGKKPAGSHCIK